MNYNNVFLVYIDQSEIVWYAVEQYGEKTEWNIGMRVGDGPMHS